jgi:hypothetical protein
VKLTRVFPLVGVAAALDAPDGGKHVPLMRSAPPPPVPVFFLWPFSIAPGAIEMSNFAEGETILQSFYSKKQIGAIQ